MTNKTTLTLESPLTQGHINDSSTFGTSPACISWINLNQLPTSSQNLVGQHLNKSTPRCIVNAFSEMMILNHISNLQFLNRNSFVFTNNLKRSFMQEIISLIENSFMKSCNLNSCLFTISTPFSLSAQSSLKFSQFLLTLPQEFRIFNFSSIRQNSETSNSNINSNMIIRNFNFFNRNIGTRKDSKPTKISLLNAESFEFSLRNSMENNRDISNLTNKNSFTRSKLPPNKLGGF